LLIDLLSMKSIVQIHKSMKGQDSLLEILVSYLNKKYQVKNGIFQRTDPHFYPQVNLDPNRKAKKILETTDFTIKDVKPRPGSSKPFRREEQTRIANY